MSLFKPVEVPCPACGTSLVCEVVHSVNADRRPELRDAMMDRSFQRETCPACGESFRMEPEFTYLHVAAKQFLTVWPASRLGEWQTLEKRGEAAFAGFYGPAAPPAAAELGRSLAQRTVFGWEAAHEKLLAAEAGIDDHSLELAKIALQSSGNGPAPGSQSALRLLGVNGEQEMVFGVFEFTTERLLEQLAVPRSLIDEVEAAAEDWQPLRDLLSQGSFVDMTRLTVEAEPAA